MERFWRWRSERVRVCTRKRARWSQAPPYWPDASCDSRVRGRYACLRPENRNTWWGWAKTRPLWLRIDECVVSIFGWCWVRTCQQWVLVVQLAERKEGEESAERAENTQTRAAEWELGWRGGRNRKTEGMSWLMLTILDDDRDGWWLRRKGEDNSVQARAGLHWRGKEYRGCFFQVNAIDLSSQDGETEYKLAFDPVGSTSSLSTIFQHLRHPSTQRHKPTTRICLKSSHPQFPRISIHPSKLARHQNHHSKNIANTNANSSAWHLP